MQEYPTRPSSHGDPSAFDSDVGIVTRPADHASCLSEASRVVCADESKVQWNPKAEAQHKGYHGNLTQGFENIGEFRPVAGMHVTWDRVVFVGTIAVNHRGTIVTAYATLGKVLLKAQPENAPTLRTFLDLVAACGVIDPVTTLRLSHSLPTSGFTRRQFSLRS